MTEELDLKDYSPYFDTEKPRRQIFGLIVGNQKDDGGEDFRAFAVFKCKGGFLTVELSWNFYDAPEDVQVVQSFCATRREVPYAVPPDFKNVLDECRLREWKPVNKARRIEWMSNRCGTMLHAWDYGQPLCRDRDVRFIDPRLWPKVKKTLLAKTPKCGTCERELPSMEGERPADPPPPPPEPPPQPKTWVPPGGGADA